MTLLAFLGLVLLPHATMAAGLGKLAVQSGLGQPLRAEIEIVNVQRAEAETLSARVASPDAFREAGVEYGAIVPQVRSVLERRGDNRYVIRLSTLNPVEEPFIDLLVELNWAAGRLVRQYTFLLDPSEYKGPQPIAAAPPKAAAPEARPVEVPKPPEVTASPPRAAAAEPAPAPVPAEKPATPATLSEPTGTYEVKEGDTLGKIAAQHRREGVSPQQMLVALYRANEDAFINKNMNLLRAGRVLNIPDRAAAESVAAPDANRIVNAQFQEFNEYRARLGQAVAAAPAPTSVPQQRATGRIAANPDEASAAPKPAPGDELRISKAEAAKAAAQARADDIAARERAVQEANSRVSDLEKNVKDLQKLLELKNQQLADLQKQAQAAKAAPPPAAKAPEPTKAPEPPKPVEVAKAPEAPKAEAPKVEAPKVEAPKAEPTVAAKAPEPPAPPALAEKPAAVAPMPVEKSPAPEAAKAAPPAPRPEAPKAADVPAKKPAPPTEPSWVETVLEEPLYLAAGGGGILALLVGGYLWRKKRSAKLENSLLGVATTDSSSVFGTTGGRSVDTGGSSLQTDFSQSGIGAIDTDEVDPVAEADVYMAYGRDAQAEEILKEALQKDPNRQAVRVKLLEIYATRKDLKAFETTAGEIYAATGGQGPEWQKAMELGLAIDPTNPMYGGKPGAGGGSRFPDAAVVPAAAGAAAAAAATDIALDLGAKPAPTIDFDLEAGDAGASTAAPDLALDVASQAPADLGFDLDLGGDSQKPAEEESDFSPSGTFIMDAATKKAVSEMVGIQSQPGGLAIDFELPGAKPAGAAAAFDRTARMTASQPVGAAFEFKLDEPTTPAPGAGGVDLGSLSFDLGKGGAEAGAPVDARWQEVATKLDLAKAYEEMGDKDGARELLNEVLKEGDAAQQQQAKQMLDALR
jgi:pilus assembly protein FimV